MVGPLAHIALISGLLARGADGPPEVERSTEILKILADCPTFGLLQDAPRPQAVGRLLPAIDRTMRRLRRFSTQQLHAALALADGATQEIPADLSFIERLWRTTARSRRSLTPFQTFGAVSGFAKDEQERTFFIDRFLFQAPTNEPFKDGDFYSMGQVLHAVHDGVIDRMYPFVFAAGKGFALRQSYALGYGMGGGYRPILEFEYYAEHYKRRPRWW